MSKKTTLTIEEFRKLPRAEQNVRERDLSDHDRFLARIGDWTPNASILVDEPELTPELIERRAVADRLLEKFIAENYDEFGKLKR